MRALFGLFLLGLLVWAQPPNDNPCGATTLTPTTGCSYTSGNLNGATASPGIPAPGCALYNGGDVWYRFTVPASGRVIIQLNSSYDLGAAIYSATACNGAFTLIECDDDDGPGSNPTICRSGNNSGCTGVDPGVTCTYHASLTPGQTIYVRVWRYNNGSPGNTPFQICVIDCGALSGCIASNYTAVSCACPPPAGGSWCGAGCTDAGITVMIGMPRAGPLFPSIFTLQVARILSSLSEPTDSWYFPPRALPLIPMMDGAGQAT